MAKKNKVPYQLVQVHWLDAVSLDKWHSPEDHLKPAAIYSIGWLVKNEPDYVVVAGSSGYDGEVGDVITVPRGMVQSIRKLSLGKPLA